MIFNINLNIIKIIIPEGSNPNYHRMLFYRKDFSPQIAPTYADTRKSERI